MLRVTDIKVIVAQKQLQWLLGVSSFPDAPIDFLIFLWFIVTLSCENVRVFTKLER
jgi:hypothetical protein